MAPAAALAGQGADLVSWAKVALADDTLFDRFAGFFHAFGCLERTSRLALDARREKEVSYRLFGKKYDSLGTLLDRVASEGKSSGDLDHYVVVSCARQLRNEIARDYPEYWSDHASDAKALEQRFQSFAPIRQRLIEQNPGDMAEFLDWFDRWFLLRATPVLEVGQ